MDFSPRLRDKILPKHRELAALILLIVLVFAGNVAWIMQDTSPATDPDANLYMERTLAYIDRPGQHDLKEVWLAVKDLNMEGRPPLYQLLSVPLVLAFGRTMDAGTFVNLFFIILLLTSVYKIGQLVANGRSGLLAAVIVAGYPTLTSLAHNYRPYFAVAACVALVVWSLLLLQKERSVRMAWLFGFSIAFGFWLYPLFLLVAPIPAAFFCLYIIFFQPHPPQLQWKTLPAWFWGKMREPVVLFGLLPSSLISIALVLAWYTSDAGQLLAKTTEWVNSPLITDFRGAEVTTLGYGNIPPSIWWYLLTSPHTLSTVFAGLLAVGIVASVLRREFYEVLLLGFFVVGYIVISQLGGLAWRYFSMLLPIAAILTGIWIGRIRNKHISTALFGLCLVTSVLNYSIVNTGLQPWNRWAVNVLGGIQGAEAVDCSVAPGWGLCPSPPLQATWPVNDVLKTVIEDPDCEQTQCNILVVFTTDHMRYSVFLYYLRQDFPQSNVSISSPGNPIMGMPIDLQVLLNSEYLVYENMPQPLGTTYDDSLVRFLLSQPSGYAHAHREVAEFALPNGHTAKLIKRVRPLTLAEAEQAIAAIDAADKFKLMQYDVLAKIYEQEGDWVNAKMYYDQGLAASDLFQYFARTDIRHIDEMIAYQEMVAGYQDKIAEYQRVLEQDPDNFEAHSGLASIFQDMNDCEQALPHWAARLKTLKNYSLYADLGDAYFKCEDWPRAIDAYQAALEFDDKAPRALVGLGWSFVAEGQVDAAARTFEKVIKYAPDTEAARKAQEWLDRQ